MIETTDNQLGEDDISADALHRSLQSGQGLLVSEVEDVCEVFESALRYVYFHCPLPGAQYEIQMRYMRITNKHRTIRADALSSHRTSLMGESMEGAYRRCNAESGTCPSIF